uniref:ABC transporter ATP-binding protein n=1 Tax=Ascaris lumbricoides TaxID=6252 RepID=A0A0M3HII8_ASCLU
MFFVYFTKIKIKEKNASYPDTSIKNLPRTMRKR